MAIIQLQFESGFTQPKVIQQWWAKFGMGKGLSLPEPLSTGDSSTCGGYEDDVWLNLELWGATGTDTSICRLSAETEPFDKATVLDLLTRVATSLQPAPRQNIARSALGEESFTWIGGWDWTGDGPPNDWSMGTTDDVISKVPAGLWASDGSLIGDGTKVANWGFVDSRRQVIYLGCEYIQKDQGEPKIQMVDGSSHVPVSSIAGVSVLRNSNSAFSATLSCDGSTIATIDYRYGKGYVSLVDVDTGQTRNLTWFDGSTGGEDISFSPDDKWLLISRTSRDSGALVINAETGSQKSFASLNHSTCWWVRDGHLGLLGIGHGSYDGPDADPYTVMFYDLTTGNQVEVVKITPPRNSMEQRYRWLWGVEPGPNNQLLVDMWVPNTLEPGSYYRNLTLLDLGTGELTPTAELFADPGHNVRRKQEKWKWNAPLPNTISAPATELESGFNPVDISVWPELEDQYGAILRVDFDSPLLTTSR